MDDYQVILGMDFLSQVRVMLMPFANFVCIMEEGAPCMVPVVQGTKTALKTLSAMQLTKEGELIYVTAMGKVAPKEKDSKPESVTRACQFQGMARDEMRDGQHHKERRYTVRDKEIKAMGQCLRERRLRMSSHKRHVDKEATAKGVLEGACRTERLAGGTLKRYEKSRTRTHHGRSSKRVSPD
ncbi:hypothetical protein AMTR_s00005p00186580 [Amborella trichopoda]|uniref:Uncharacterized protein n=1 Tax=Amborella trichopoda TaxID=13333 RepID=W1PFR9_AMBTC|nr:hypothetical protein AMTR_s00005p00186580 [Amborella trichopoda]